jgi:Family of unknown function (DUF6261)
MFTAIQLTKLRNAEYVQYLQQLLAIVLRYQPATLQVKAEYDALFADFTKLEGSFKTRTSSPLTAELETLDEQRDNCITGLYYYLLGLSSHFTTAKSAPAQALLQVLQVYGTGIARQNLNAETATLNSLIADFKKPENAAHGQTLGIADWVTEMERVNQLFNQTYLARNQAEGLDTSEAIKAIRTIADVHYYELRNVLEAHYLISKKAANYTQCLNEINALTDSYITLLNGRKSNKSNKGNQPPAKP